MYRAFIDLSDKSVRRYFILERMIVLIELIMIFLLIRYNIITQEQIIGMKKDNTVNNEVLMKLDERFEITKQDINGIQKDINTIIDMYSRNEITYDSNNLSKSAYVNASEFNMILKGTNLEGLGKSLVQAEQKYNINSIFLLSLIIHESGWGTNKLSIEKNNITSYCAYDKSPFISAKAFTSKEECIDVTAKHLSHNYLTENGQYFNGYGIEDINVFYAQDKSWHVKITNIVRQIVKKLLSNK